MATEASEHVRLDFDGAYEVARWRPLVHWLLAIPHYFITYFLNIGVGILTFISFFSILFTKQIPEGIFNFIIMAQRYQWRLVTYVLWMRESYPPFEFEMTTEDPGTDPARLAIDRAEEYKRWAPLYKWFIAIPHYFVLLFFQIGAFFVIIASWFAVLFTGSYPAGMRSYVVRVSRYQWRVRAYVTLLRDEYPAFGLD